jgi:hypothetical protein
MTVVYAPWKGAEEACIRAVDLVEPLFGSCAPSGRTGWYLPGGFTTG